MSVAPVAARRNGASALERALDVTRAMYEQNAQLEQALRSRVVVEQAKGVLAERLGIGIDDAFELLRRAARSNRTRLRPLAERVIASPTTPREIERSLRPGGATRKTA